MKIFKTPADVKDIQFGDQYVADVFPDDPQDKAYEDIEQLLSRRNAIDNAVAEAIKPPEKEVDTPDKKDPVKPDVVAPKEVAPKRNN